MNQQAKASRHFNLQPITARHLDNVASWYQNIDELALIESNLPLPVSAKSLETLWQQDLEFHFRWAVKRTSLLNIERLVFVVTLIFSVLWWIRPEQVTGQKTNGG